jgi:aspartyl aminopeptidase
MYHYEKEMTDKVYAQCCEIIKEVEKRNFIEEAEKIKIDPRIGFGCKYIDDEDNSNIIWNIGKITYTGFPLSVSLIISNKVKCKCIIFDKNKSFNYYQKKTTIKSNGYEYLFNFIADEDLNLGQNYSLLK